MYLSKFITKNLLDIKLFFTFRTSTTCTTLYTSRKLDQSRVLLTPLRLFVTFPSISDSTLPGIHEVISQTWESLVITINVVPLLQCSRNKPINRPLSPYSLPVTLFVLGPSGLFDARIFGRISYCLRTSSRSFFSFPFLRYEQRIFSRKFCRICH